MKQNEELSKKSENDFLKVEDILLNKSRKKNKHKSRIVLKNILSNIDSLILK